MAPQAEQYLATARAEHQQLTQENLRSLSLESLLLFGWADVRPLHGATAMLDWVVCGRLSRPWIDGRFRGEYGEVLLSFIHIGRWRFRAFFVGLGPQEQSTRHHLAAAVQFGCQVLDLAKVEKITLVVPSSGSDCNLQNRFMQVLGAPLATRFEKILYS